MDESNFSFFQQAKNKPLTIGDALIQPGERLTLGLPTPELYTYASLHTPIHIIHGKKAGPTLLLCAAIHGDEMNGTAIIHRLLKMRLLKGIYGTLIALPVVNVYGLLTLSRSLPDRRDLDGSFPGSERGSFAARLAHYLNREILSKATHCIDIHSGEPHQYRLPHVQGDLSIKEVKNLAEAFQAPALLHTSSQRGLLWQNQCSSPIPTLIYDAGEPLRLDEWGIRIGLRGILGVMRTLGMLKIKSKASKTPSSTIVKKSEWVFSPGSGLCEHHKKVGSYVKKGEKIAEIYDPFGTGQQFQLLSPHDGVVLTKHVLPLVNEGDPVIQIAHTGASFHVQEWEESLQPENEYRG